jgi:hypothetical protein
MIIKSSAIQLNSQHQFLKRSQESESFRSWKTQNEPTDRAVLTNKQPMETVNISKAAQTLKPEKQSLDLSEPPDANDSVTMLIIKQMIKELTGQDFKLFSPSELTAGTNETAIDTSNVEIATAPPPENQPPSAGFGLVYEHHSRYQESESASFSATGSIKTQDGKSIEFSVQLNMSRDFLRETNFSIRAGDPEKKSILLLSILAAMRRSCRRRVLSLILMPMARLNKSLY